MSSREFALSSGRCTTPDPSYTQNMPVAETVTTAHAAHYQTRGALAGSRKGKGAYLSHVVLIDGPEIEAREMSVLCGRIDLDNIADCYSGNADSHAEAATCKTCAARDPRRK